MKVFFNKIQFVKADTFPRKGNESKSLETGQENEQIEKTFNKTIELGVVEKRKRIFKCKKVTMRSGNNTSSTFDI